MYTANEWFKKKKLNAPVRISKTNGFFLSSFEWQAMIDSLLVLKQSADILLIKTDSRSAQNQQYLSPTSFQHCTASNITTFMITFVNYTVSKATSPADKSSTAEALVSLALNRISHRLINCMKLHASTTNWDWQTRPKNCSSYETDGNGAGKEGKAGPFK